MSRDEGTWDEALAFAEGIVKDEPNPYDDIASARAFLVDVLKEGDDVPQHFRDRATAWMAMADKLLGRNN